MSTAGNGGGWQRRWEDHAARLVKLATATDRSKLKFGPMNFNFMPGSHWPVASCFACDVQGDHDDVWASECGWVDVGKGRPRLDGRPQLASCGTGPGAGSRAKGRADG